MLKLDSLSAFLTLVKADFCKNKTSNLVLLLCCQVEESAVCKGVCGIQMTYWYLLGKQSTVPTNACSPT